MVVPQRARGTQTRGQAGLCDVDEEECRHATACTAHMRALSPLGTGAQPGQGTAATVHICTCVSTHAQHSAHLGSCVTRCASACPHSPHSHSTHLAHGRAASAQAHPAPVGVRCLCRCLAGSAAAAALRLSVRGVAAGGPCQLGAPQAG